MRLDGMSFNVEQSIQNSVAYQNLNRELMNNLELVDISIDPDKVANESFLNEIITKIKMVKNICDEKINALKKVKEEFFKSIQDLINKKTEYEIEINNYYLTCRLLTLSNQQFKKYSDYSERAIHIFSYLRKRNWPFR